MYDDIDEHTDDDAVAAIRKAVRNDDANKLIGILESTQITPNTPIAITLQSSVDRKKKLSLLWPPIILAAYAQKLRVMNVSSLDNCSLSIHEVTGTCGNAIRFYLRWIPWMSTHMTAALSAGVETRSTSLLDTIALRHSSC